jgi:hypothetical protein
VDAAQAQARPQRRDLYALRDGAGAKTSRREPKDTFFNATIPTSSQHHFSADITHYIHIYKMRIHSFTWKLLRIYKLLLYENVLFQASIVLILRYTSKFVASGMIVTSISCEQSAISAAHMWNAALGVALAVSAVRWAAAGSSHEVIDRRTPATKRRITLTYRGFNTHRRHETRALGHSNRARSLLTSQSR